MMSLIRNSLVLGLSAACFLFANSAGAQERGQERSLERIRILETRVNQLEGIISQINQRVSNLEYNQRPEPYPPVAAEVACMVTDTGYSKVFLGKGRIKLEAEAAAREACGKAVHSSYCQGAVKCSDPRQDRPIAGAICMLTDTGYAKTFKGEGKSLIEAEYNTRKQCGDQVHPSYCVGSIRCETF
ncbi:hypothetical protein predicted by Glimmer/Critica [Bdellovibrio bacteriovorus HD100]|uniref:DUF4189 domain-containing protein n=2 Tax=Bdellovibrio bacteriovorus TaxID=959 RepID=Q6MK59_BDEBA|nr:hypothetical protein predicted by Glimmer/Critica [Bdellovibrio bacteriovorus HD100]